MGEERGGGGGVSVGGDGTCVVGGVMGGGGDGQLGDVGGGGAARLGEVGAVELLGEGSVLAGGAWTTATVMSFLTSDLSEEVLRAFCTDLGER